MSSLQEKVLKEGRSRSNGQDQSETLEKGAEALEGNFNWRRREHPTASSGRP
jgi:hypothetical protein